MTASTEARNSETKVSLRQRWTRAAQRLVDLLVCALAFQFAYLLRFDFSIPASVSEQLNVQLPYVVVLQVVTLGLFGIQTFIWRYVGMAELKAFIGAALSSAGVLLAARLFLQDPTWSATWRVPLSVIVLDTGLAYGGLVAVRILRRLLHERHRQSGVVPGGDAKARRPVMLIGAGRNGMMAAREIQGNPDSALDIRGFVDDDPNKKGTVIQGVRVLGSTQDLPRLVAKAEVDHVVVTIEKLSRAQFQRIRDVCDAIPVKMRIAPSMSQILDGRLQVSRIRDVQVDDLLGRAPVDLDLTDMARLIAGRTVMVTGAGGSIGRNWSGKSRASVPGECSWSSDRSSRSSTSSARCVRRCRTSSSVRSWPTSPSSRGCGRCSSGPDPPSCSTPQPTSTSRCSSTTRPRRSPTTCSRRGRWHAWPASTRSRCSS